MPEHEEFQYAVLRIVPDVERGEALNAGVVVFSRRRGFLAARVGLDPERLLALAPGADADAVRRHLDGLVRIADGDPGGGAIAALPQSERFGFLAAPSSTIVQPGPIHTGLCDDPQKLLDRLYDRLVAPPSA